MLAGPPRPPAAALLLALLPGCFFLPFRPDGPDDPYGDHPYGSDPDVDDDLDGFTETGGDCDDGDDAVYPGAVEQANGVDDDCDGEVDEPPTPVDDDGDGWSVEDGDCDDGDAGVHPDRVDDCDGIDSDCDGEVDEDAVDDDPQEPNDAQPFHLGDVTDAAATVAGYLHNDDDVDRFSFFVDDTLFGSFRIELALDGVPGDGDYVLELRLGDDTVGYSDGSGGEQITFEGAAWHDDAGTYEAIVSSALGASCSHPYVLLVEGSG